MLNLAVNGQQMPDAKQKGLDAITENSVSGMLEYLSSDWMEGRAVGTRGEYMAGDYIASMFKVFGLQPGGDMITTSVSRLESAKGLKSQTYRSFYQSFPMIEYSAGENQRLEIILNSKDGEQKLVFNNKTDFSVNPGQVAISVNAPVVFVGYGINDDTRKFNEYEGVNVKGKIILRMTGFPGSHDTLSSAWKTFKPANRTAAYQLLASRNEAALKAGASAILEFNPMYELQKDFASNIPFRFNSDLYESDTRPESFYDTRLALPLDTMDTTPPVFNISYRVAHAMLKQAGIDPKVFLRNMSANPKPSPVEIKGLRASCSTEVNSRIITGRNIIGVLEGKNTEEIIVVGAHYDHLGKFNGAVWNGADDNASGTVGVMAIAKACLATGGKPEKTIVFAAWTGEEKGLHGSKYFAEHPWDNKKIILNLNYDMISRDDADDERGVRCQMSYTKAFPELEKISRLNLNKYGLGLEVRYRPAETASGGSDHAPFARKGIPYFYFMAGFPPEYHQSNDHFKLVNTRKMTAIIKLGFLNIWDTANTDDWRSGN
jgi:hypothetical protein